MTRCLSEPHRKVQCPKAVAAVAAAMLAAGALASDSTNSAAPVSPYEAKASDSIQRGLSWLAGIQKEDGSWSNPDFPALTALGLWAFSRSTHPDKGAVCSKAAGFVSGLAQEDGGIYKPGGRGGGLSTYNTAICMSALHSYDRTRYAPIILRARKFMARSQLVGDSPGAGGFGYDQNPPPMLYKAMMAVSGRQWADLSNTGWALQSMRLTQDVEDLRPGGKTVDVDWNAALKFVEKMQNRDASDPVNNGSFAYQAGGARGGTHVGKDGKVKLTGYGSMTYAGMESMIYAQVGRSDPRVVSAIDWASRHWSVDENPGMGTKGLFYYYSIMCKSLSLTGSDILPRQDGEPINWKKEVIEKLSSIQQPDGRWVNQNNQFWEGDAALVTAYAVLSIEYAIGR